MAAIGRIGFARATLHLGALWALAFVQPLFGLLADNAEFFVARGSPPSDILELAFGYGLVPPLVAGSLVWLAGRVRPALGAGALLALIGVLVAVLVLPPLGDLLSGSAAALPLALLAGTAAALAYARVEGARLFLSVLAPAPLVVLVLFLFVSPVSGLAFPRDASSATAGPSRSDTPIVLLVLDELPEATLMGADGSIDARQFPNLAALARDATWYRNATTVADSTPEAVPAQLTGMLPRKGDLPITADHPRSLFTLFGRSHDLTVVEPITDICPERLCVRTRPDRSTRLRALRHDLEVVLGHVLLPEHLTGGLAEIDETWEGFGEPEPSSTTAQVDPRTGRSALVEDTLVRLRFDDAPAGFARATAALDGPHDRPPLLFVHSTLPHSPWRFLPDGRTYPAARSPVPGLGEPWTHREWLVEQSFQRHVLQVRYVDRMVGRLLDRLKADGLYDDAVVVVTSDHGAAFQAGYPRRNLDRRTTPDIAAIPFLVKRPGQHAAAVSDAAVRTVDVLPTIAAAAGVRVPWRTDGMDAARRPVDPGAPIEVTSARGRDFTLPLKTIVARREQRNALESRLLAGGPGAFGPRRDLLGRRVASVPRARRPAHATLDGRADYRSVVDGAATVPAFASGEVRGVAADTVLAIAVDGRIRATTRVYPDGGRKQFSTLLPVASLPPGSHAIDVLEVLPGDDLRRLGGT